MPLTPETRRSISMRRRLTELSGSMVVAAVCTAVITLGLAWFTSLLSSPWDSQWSASPSAAGLFAIVTLLGSWGVLAFAKLSEGTDLPAMPRRLCLLGVGLLVGAVGWGVDQVLLVDLSWYGPHDALYETFGPHTLIAGNSPQPKLAGFAVFFAGLFALRQWWRHADSFREKRFRLSTLLVTGGAAFLLTLVFAFPQVWGLTWAAAICSVVQLSAVWMPHERRRQLVEEAGHGA